LFVYTYVFDHKLIKHTQHFSCCLHVYAGCTTHREWARVAGTAAAQQIVATVAAALSLPLHTVALAAVALTDRRVTLEVSELSTLLQQPFSTGGQLFSELCACSFTAATTAAATAAAAAAAASSTTAGAAAAATSTAAAVAGSTTAATTAGAAIAGGGTADSGGACDCESEGVGTVENTLSVTDITDVSLEEIDVRDDVSDDITDDITATTQRKHSAAEDALAAFSADVVQALTADKAFS
jgi:hypothetical protein